VARAQTTLHAVAPEQLTLQPPAGQVTLQVLLPWHKTVLPGPTVKLHVLVPPQVTLPLMPAASAQVLPPVQVDVQFSLQLPEHCDWPAQLVVQPVPQVTLQSFFDSQLNVAPLGGADSEPPSPPEPSVQVPPDWQLQVAPVHEQAPVHAMTADDDDPEHAPNMQRSDAVAAKSMERFAAIGFGRIDERNTLAILAMGHVAKRAMPFANLCSGQRGYPAVTPMTNCGIAS
jgi:hypothetical protein